MNVLLFDAMFVIPKRERAAGLLCTGAFDHSRVPLASKYRQVSARGPPLAPPNIQTAESKDRYPMPIEYRAPGPFPLDTVIVHEFAL